jgi:serine/threonine protein kinase
LSEWAAADPEARARFEREATTISQLNHPNICIPCDIGEAPQPAAEPVHYLVLEYLEGESPAARIARAGAGRRSARLRDRDRRRAR